MHPPVGGWGDHHVETVFSILARMLLGYDIAAYYRALALLFVVSVVVIVIIRYWPTREEWRSATKWLFHW